MSVPPACPPFRHHFKLVSLKNAALVTKRILISDSHWLIFRLRLHLIISATLWSLVCAASFFTFFFLGNLNALSLAGGDRGYQAIYMISHSARFIKRKMAR